LGFPLSDVAKTFNLDEELSDICTLKFVKLTRMANRVTYNQQKAKQLSSYGPDWQ
jgi:hypothetical protein